MVAYGAGSTGFGLWRSLNAAGIRRKVVAPAKVATALGEPDQPTLGTGFTWTGDAARRDHDGDGAALLAGGTPARA